MDDIFVEIGSHDQFVEETDNKIGTCDDLVINKDHSTPADSGRTGHGEIGHFEEYFHFEVQLDSLSVG
jgi:hypothetical protein